MTEDGKTDFDPVAEALKQAALENTPDLCEQFYGRAKRGNIYVNAIALRIAAENKSYEAFECMLAIAAEGACGITSPDSIGLGPDWSRVQEIAQTDERIRAALQTYDEQIEKNITEVFGMLWGDDSSTEEEVPPAPRQQGFFERLKPW